MNNKLKNKIADLKNQLRNKEEELQRNYQNCIHAWGETVADHIYHKGYTIPGDEPGTCGVDWRGPCYVEPKTEYRWKRTCKRCEKVEYTTNTDDIVTKKPRFY